MKQNRIRHFLRGAGMGLALLASAATPLAVTAADADDDKDINDGRKTTRGDLYYNGFSDVIFARETIDGTELEYALDGDEPEKQETLDPSYLLIGTYDMDRDHAVDLVACRLLGEEHARIIEVGYAKSGKMDQWHVIGSLGNPDDVDWDIRCGNLSGKWNRNSILWHAPSLGALGYWPDGKGVDSWVTIPGKFDAKWRILGLGVFTESARSLRNAQKPRDSVLFLYGTDTVGYVTPDDGKFTVLGKLEADWEIAVIGDFSRSGLDDLILFNTRTRQVGKWEKGRAENWKSLGFLKAGAAIEGAGDYDGDGRMDLLARQADGSMGYFKNADLKQFVPFGYKMDPSWTVIP